MKTLFAGLLLSFLMFSCQAEITQVNDMDELFSAFNNANGKTLAVFDVDMVLVQPKNPAFQMPNMKRYGAVCKNIMSQIPADKQMMFLSLMTTSSDTMLIDDRTPQFLKNLAQKGVPTMALTSNLTGRFSTIDNMEEWRIASLRALGIDFAKNAPYAHPLVFENLDSYRGNYCTYKNGIFFVNGSAVSKGDAFLSFLAKTGLSPSKVIFVDDRSENIKSMEAALNTLSIDFVGIHYTGAQKYPSETVSEEAFVTEWQKLARLTQEL